MKIERVKFQQRTNVKQKTTLVRKVSLKNSVMKIKRHCRRRKNLNILQVGIFTILLCTQNAIPSQLTTEIDRF